MEVKSERFR